MIPPYTLAWFRELIDPRITSVEIKAWSDHVSVHVYWHEDYPGGTHCRASLTGCGQTVSSALDNLHGGFSSDPRPATLVERFQQSVDSYAEHRYVKIALDPDDVEEVAALEKETADRHMAQINESQRRIDDRIFAALKKKGYDFRFKSCAPFHGMHRDDKGRVVAVEVIDPEQGHKLEEKWAFNASLRAGL